MARYVPKEGYIQLWRRLRDHRFWPTYKRRKFTDLEAWIDLLFDATYKPHRREFRGQVFDLKPGELVFSQNEKADQWRWKRNEVRAFLDSLYLNGEAVHEECQNVTRLCVCKLAGYATYSPEVRPMSASTGKKGSKKGGEEGEVGTTVPLSSNIVQELVQGLSDKLGWDRKKKGDE